MLDTPQLNPNPFTRNTVVEMRREREAAGIPLLTEEAAPPPTTPDGPALLRDMESFLSRFVILPPHTKLPLVAWAIASYCYDTFDAMAYLCATSPTPRCGKTRLLEVLGLLVANPERTANVSEAALFRVIEANRPTLMLDEAETLKGKGERAEYLRGLLNAGNRRDAIVTRCVGQSHEVKRFSVYCPKIVAGIGSMPHTIRDRSILIEMQRRTTTERVDRFMFRTARPEGQELNCRASSFVAGNLELIGAAYAGVDLPFLEDRDCEAWESLFAVVYAADRSRLKELQQDAQHLSGKKQQGEIEESLSQKLLADLREIWPDGEGSAFSAHLVAALKGIEDAPWASEVELTQRKLARFLRPFNVESRQVRVESKTAKGYLRSELEPAFARYLVLETKQGKQP